MKCKLSEDGVREGMLYGISAKQAEDMNAGEIQEPARREKLTERPEDHESLDLLKSERTPQVLEDHGKEWVYRSQERQNARLQTRTSILSLSSARAGAG